MSFCTVINCMDGRTQLPVIKYLQQRFGVDYVDSITEPGPNKILAEQTDSHLLDSIFQRLQISLEKHHSVGLAVVGHADCAGNPVAEQEQEAHTRRAVEYLKGKYENLEIIGLWVDANWNVVEISASDG